jgi:hypothetical protein
VSREDAPSISQPLYRPLNTHNTHFASAAACMYHEVQRLINTDAQISPARHSALRKEITTKGGPGPPRYAAVLSGCQSPSVNAFCQGSSAKRLGNPCCQGSSLLSSRNGMFLISCILVPSSSAENSRGPRIWSQTEIYLSANRLGHGSFSPISCLTLPLTRRER